MKKRGNFKKKTTKPKPRYQANLSKIRRAQLDMLLFGNSCIQINHIPVTKNYSRFSG